MSRTIINSRFVVWLVLALPGLVALAAYGTGRAEAMDMLHPTGEWAVRFMVLAMAIGPLAAWLGPRGWLRWLLARRRWIGVAAFIYALAHLAFYLVDMGVLADVLAELTEHGIWTGWAAFALMAALACTSNDAAMRALGRGWKRLQRLAYPAAVLTVLHWGLLMWDWLPALIHFGPLAVLNFLRAGRRFSSPQRKGLPA